MLAAIVTAAVVSTTPTTYDVFAAHADLHMPYGSPPLTERSPRMRMAMLQAMLTLGVLDHDSPDFRWFTPSLSWAMELDCARNVAARVRECPTLAEGAWVPPPSWFRVEAAAAYANAVAWQKRADEYRSRELFEGHHADELLTWARYFEAVSYQLQDQGYRLNRWGGGAWQAPRRVALAEIREAIGAAAWVRREWPVSE